MAIPMVKLYGYVTDLIMRPAEATKILIRVAPAPQYSGQYIFSSSDIKLLSNENGYFEVSLPAGIGVTVIIPAADYQVSGVLPNQAEVQVTSLDKQPTKIITN